MLLGNGQGGTVDPLVNLFPFLCLEGVEPFASITHPGDTSGKVVGTPPHTCTHPTGLSCAPGPLGNRQGCHPGSDHTQHERTGSIFRGPGGDPQELAHSVFSTALSGPCTVSFLISRGISDHVTGNRRAEGLSPFSKVPGRITHNSGLGKLAPEFTLQVPPSPRPREVRCFSRPFCDR